MQSVRNVLVKTNTPYTVHIGPGLLARCGELARQVTKARRACIITDDIVAPLYGQSAAYSLEQSGFQTEILVLPNGEASKSLPIMERIYDFLAEKQITRSDILVALGGGVIGDITGFAAATWQRGIGFIQLPTTLLAAVDSSVGGKTGVNIPAGKNLVGAFWQPLTVVCDPSVFETLSDEIFADGTAEVIKTALIRDAALFDLLAAGQLRQKIEQVIGRCVAIKATVVAEDELDTGLRMLLNFGHTLGHAIEKESGFTIHHGHAVASGMVRISRACEQAGIAHPGLTEEIKECLALYGLPADCDISDDILCRHAMGDKKRSGDYLTLAVVPRAGEGGLYRLPAAELPAFLSGRYRTASL